MAALLAIGVGCVLGAWTLLKAFEDKPPPLPLIFGLVAAAGLEIATGTLMLAGKRAAWAFAMSLTGVMAVAGVVALPALVRLGIAPPVAALLLGLVLLLLVLLVLSREAF